LIDLEQFADYLRCRTFRRTLLCHSEAEIVHTPDPAVLGPMYFTALVKPASPTPDVTSDAAEKFIFDDGATATTSNPVFKAALVELFERWPRGVPFDELLGAVLARLQVADAQAGGVGQLLAAHLVRGYIAHLVSIHSEPFRFVLEVGERPRASALARYLSGARDTLPTLRHRLVALPPAERSVLRLFDGSRSVDEIVAEFAPRSEFASEEPDAGAFVARCVQGFARAALLEA
jgi:methyltransferase-like protein